MPAFTFKGETVQDFVPYLRYINDDGAHGPVSCVCCAILKGGYIHVIGLWYARKNALGRFSGASDGMLVVDMDHKEDAEAVDSTDPFPYYYFPTDPNGDFDEYANKVVIEL